MLHAQRLSYNFGTHWALKDVSFRLRKGDFLFLTGPSGSGKTTLMRLIYGALPIKRGNLWVAGQDLKTMPGRRLPLLRRQVSFVFQDFKIMPRRTVFDNVALALEVRFLPRPHIEKRVRAVLRGLRLEKKAQALCGELSGGEQQRVAIARAIVVNPRLLLADEPSGNLDPELALRIMEVFGQFHSHGATIIMATHNQELLDCQPRAKHLRLAGGTITHANWPLDDDGPADGESTDDDADEFPEDVAEHGA